MIPQLIYVGGALVLSAVWLCAAWLARQAVQFRGTGAEHQR